MLVMRRARLQRYEVWLVVGIIFGLGVLAGVALEALLGLMMG